MIEVIIDTLLDGLKLLPFLFVTFLVIELIEHKLKSKKKLIKTKNMGPIIGSVLGAIPQCGFATVATNLYVTRIITLGTLISIYLSTSDEMLPILISEQANIDIILKVIGLKIIIGIISGFIIDLLIRKKEQINYHICDNDHCNCEEGIMKGTIKHTLNVLVFVLIITFILNVVFLYINEDTLSKILLKNSLLTPFVASLIGLIPNCGISIILTELFLNNIISFGTMISGLLTGSGVALLVLFKVNKNIKENIMIMTILYIIGSLAGLIIELL